MRKIFGILRLTALPEPGPVVVANLSMELKAQERTMWCWAAVAFSVAVHANRPSIKNQCQLAVALVDGCFDCADSACNRPGSVRDALAREGIQVDSQPLPLGADVIELQLATGPVVCEVKAMPTALLKHVVIIDRLFSDGKVHVSDPDRGAQNRNAWERKWNLAVLNRKLSSFFLP